MGVRKNPPVIQAPHHLVLWFVPRLNKPSRDQWFAPGDRIATQQKTWTRQPGAGEKVISCCLWASICFAVNRGSRYSPLMNIAALSA